MAYLKTIEIKDLFKHCYYHERPFVYLRALRIHCHNMQLKANIEFVVNNTQLTKKECGWCNSIINDTEFDYFAGYWSPHLWRAVHKNCKREYQSYEIKECQTIDADCNDCKHFERLNAIATGVFIGNCKKLNKETKAYVNVVRDYECFEHRRN